MPGTGQPSLLIAEGTNPAHSLVRSRVTSMMPSLSPSTLTQSSSAGAPGVPALA